MRITEPGIYFDFPEAEYHADPCEGISLNQSLAKVIIERETTAHAFCQHPRLKPPADDDKREAYRPDTAIGNAAHSLMLGRGKKIVIRAFKDWTSGDAKRARAEAEAAGHVAILEKHFNRATSMVLAAREQLDAAGCKEAFVGGHSEVVIAWQEDGFWFRSMIDWCADPRRLYDYKTTGLSVAPHAIPMLMSNAGWAIQAAFQERGLDVLDPEGRGRRKFRFVAQENDEPYALTPCELPELTITIGRKQVDYAIKRWKHSMRTGEWPGYPNELLRPALPEFRERQWLDREIEHADRSERASRREPMPDDIMAAG
jgi:hypothetical protein